MPIQGVHGWQRVVRSRTGDELSGGVSISGGRGGGKFSPLASAAVRIRGMEFFLKFVVGPAIVAAIFWPLVLSIINAKDPPP